MSEGARWLTVPGVLALTVALTPACVSLAGLTDGDASVSHDAGATRDAPMMLPLDAMRARADAVVDAVPDRATLEDARPDAGDAAPVCEPVETPDASAPATCAAPPDAAATSCAPSPLLSAALQWIPPNTPQAVCTSAEIAALSTGGTISEACSECVYSYIGMSSYGPVIQFPQVVQGVWTSLNLGGCIALLDPCNLPCAKAVFALDQCDTEACLALCPGDTQTSFDELNACATTEALACPCAAYEEAAQKCVAKLVASHSVATQCLGDLALAENPADQTTMELLAIATVFCGAP